MENIRINPSYLAMMRQDHRDVVNEATKTTVCNYCHNAWPCEVVKLLGHIRAVEEDKAADAYRRDLGPQLQIAREALDAIANPPTASQLMIGIAQKALDDMDEAGEEAE